MARRRSPRPQSMAEFLGLILALSIAAALMSCGGGAATSHFSGGGGGGGGGAGPNCTQPTPVTTAPNATNGVGQVVPATFMDMHLGNPNAAWPTVSFGGLRLWDTGTGWAEVNTAKDQYDFSQIDNFVSLAQQHGVDLLYNLARTPSWISTNPGDTSCAYNVSVEGGPGQCEPPSDLASDGSGTDAAWIAWVSAIASRNKNTYADAIKYYEIWNEWNIKLFWVGTSAQLVRMEQDARCVVEGPPAGLSCNPNSTFPSGTALDPAAKIVTPSPVGAGYPANNLQDVANNFTVYFGTSVNGIAGGAFADVIGYHGYVGTRKGAGVCPIPENAGAVVDNMVSVLNQFGETGKPWFNTEGGWSKAQDEGFTDPDRQAAFLPRYHLIQASMGVSRVYWYRWDAGQTYGGSLWTPSSGATPAATAYGEVYKWIVGATLTNACGPVSAGSTVWSCGFSRNNGAYKALALWDVSQDCTSSACPAPAYNVPSGGYTMFRDVTGAENPISGSTVAVGAKPILLETSALP